MRIYPLKKIDKFRENCYTGLFVMISILTGIGLGVAMLIVERILI